MGTAPQCDYQGFYKTCSRNLFPPLRSVITRRVDSHLLRGDSCDQCHLDTLLVRAHYVCTESPPTEHQEVHDMTEREFIEADDYIEVSVNYTVPVVAQVRLYRDPSDDTVWSVHVLDESVALDKDSLAVVWASQAEPGWPWRAATLARAAVEIAEGDEDWPSWEFGF